MTSGIRRMACHHGHSMLKHCSVVKQIAAAIVKFQPSMIDDTHLSKVSSSDILYIICVANRKLL